MIFSGDGIVAEYVQAEPYVDSTGYFRMSTPEGLFSIYFIPFTTGYHLGKGNDGASIRNL